jgi:hypothetical protein
MLLAHLVSGRYGRPQDGETQTPRQPSGWIYRLLRAIFRAR